MSKFNIDIAIKDKGVCTNQKCSCDECEVGHAIGYEHTKQLCPHEVVLEIAKLVKALML